MDARGEASVTIEQPGQRRCPGCGAVAADDAAFCDTCGARLSAVVKAPQPAAAQELADFWSRFAAFLLDSVIVGFSFPFLAGLLFGAGAGSGAFVLLLFLYAAYFWMGNGLGGTLGKRIVGLAVVDERGETPGLTRGLVRYLVSIVSALAFYLGYFWMIWDAQKQTWHDKAAGTHVVRRAQRAATAA